MMYKQINGIGFHYYAILGWFSNRWYQTINRLKRLLDAYVGDWIDLDKLQSKKTGNVFPAVSEQLIIEHSCAI